ncbi:hypothetical protein M3223_11775 [Paenibacillus pasadenensis]|nr:hypothetical protein [Paenibacillus pasadenensis]
MPNAALPAPTGAGWALQPRPLLRIESDTNHGDQRRFAPDAQLGKIPRQYSIFVESVVSVIPLPFALF